MAIPITQLRKAVLSDLPELLTLARTAFVQTFMEGNKPDNVAAYMEEAFTEEQFVRELQEPASTFILASWEGCLVGYTKVNLAPEQTDLNDSDTVEVARLYVLEEVLGLGVGQLLFDEAVAFGRAQGKASLWLGVWEHNARAIRFYEKNGLVRFGSHPFPFGDEVQNDWLMRKVI
jgi:ribosomal protein S18 acetylase RimI-like enzyme